MYLSIQRSIQAPFRKIRFFLYFGLLGAAGIGSFISLVKLLAASTGSSNDDVGAILPNLFVNLLGIPILSYLWNRELKAQNSKLERIQKGGSLAGLKVKVSVGEENLVVKLSDLRRDRGIEKRVILVVAPLESIKESLQSSLSASKSFMSNNILIIPLVIENSSPESFTLEAANLISLLPSASSEQLKYIGTPLVLSSWNAVLRREILTALKQQPNALEKGITIVIKNTGKVASRKFGVPIWDSNSETKVGGSDLYEEIASDKLSST